MLSKALKLQQYREDAKNKAIMSDLRSEVEMLHDLFGKRTTKLHLRSALSHPGFRGPKPRREIIAKCAGTKSHTYDESWHMIECHIFTI
jgi:hypothetical protein